MCRLYIVNDVRVMRPSFWSIFIGMHGMKRLLLLTLFISSTVWAAIPATPVMTLYRFNSALEIPYYSSKNFRDTGPSAPVGTLAQGSSVVPCIVVDDGLP